MSKRKSEKEKVKKRKRESERKLTGAAKMVLVTDPHARNNPIKCYKTFLLRLKLL